MPTPDAADLPPIRRLTPADLPALLELRATAAAGLPPGFVWPKTEAQLRAYLDGASAAFGVAGSDGALSACALLHLPAAGRPNPGPAFPRVPGADWPLRACGLEGTVVRPAARGRGLQRALVDARLAGATRAGMRWAYAGVRLDNAVSWANLLARSLVIVGMRFDPGYPILGLLRPLDLGALRTDPGDRVPVGAGDPARHQAALDAGYVGVRLATDGSVTYERLVTLAGRLLHPDDPVREAGGDGALAGPELDVSHQTRRHLELARRRATALLGGRATTCCATSASRGDVGRVVRAGRW